MANDDMPPELSDEDQKALALDLILDAWDSALEQGVSPDLLASTAIFAALTDLVDSFGPDPVAEMAESLPGRIRSGEFTFEASDEDADA